MSEILTEGGALPLGEKAAEFLEHRRSVDELVSSSAFSGAMEALDDAFARNNEMALKALDARDTSSALCYRSAALSYRNARALIEASFSRKGESLSAEAVAETKAKKQGGGGAGEAAGVGGPDGGRHNHRLAPDGGNGGVPKLQGRRRSLVP